MKGKILAFVLFTIQMVILPGVFASDNELVIVGPERMSKFTGAWVEKFRQDNPFAIINFRVAKEDEGFVDLLRGRCDIVISSTGPQEAALYKDVKMNKTVVAAEGVVFLVNQQNPVKGLTLTQLADILSGKTMNWEDVGGSYGEIFVYGPPAVSWVNGFILKNILNVFSPDNKRGIAYRVNNIFSNDEIRQQVAVQPLAMGYCSGNYVPAGLKALSVAKGDPAEYILPVKDKISNTSYPLQQPVFLWARDGDASVALFIDRVLSKDYQEMLSAYGFYPAKASDQNSGSIQNRED